MGSARAQPQRRITTVVEWAGPQLEGILTFPERAGSVSWWRGPPKFLAPVVDKVEVGGGRPRKIPLGTDLPELRIAVVVEVRLSPGDPLTTVEPAVRDSVQYTSTPKEVRCGCYKS